MVAPCGLNNAPLAPVILTRPAVSSASSNLTPSSRPSPYSDSYASYLVAGSGHGDAGCPRKYWASISSALATLPTSSTASSHLGQELPRGLYRNAAGVPQG